MLKRGCIVLYCIFFCAAARADHLSGSELTYEYLGRGSSASSQVYRFTYRLFRSCNSTSPTLDFESVDLGIYQANDKALYTHVQLGYQGTTTIALNTANIHCFTGSIAACYGVGVFTGVIELPVSAAGYIAAWIRCCRPGDLANMPRPDIGLTPMVTIPGTSILPSGFNSSAAFYTRDTALVCAGKNFRIDFSASDPDGDSLSYSFDTGIDWSPQWAFNPGPQPTLVYSPVAYAPGYSATNPLGTSTLINAKTGEIVGVAPAAGRYLVCIKVAEWRNGRLINAHTKEIPIVVGNCDFLEARLPDKIIQCSSKQVYFENQSASSGVVAYKWTFDTSRSASVSAAPTPVYTYSDSGTYVAKLVVTGSTGCKDSATTRVQVYPGFKGGYKYDGVCIRYPYQFIDTSTRGGFTAVRWTWNFGENTNVGTTSNLPGPQVLFLTPGNKTVKLIVESDKGCSDTVYHVVNIRDKPSLTLNFSDTTICRGDSVLLRASSAGSVSYDWSPKQYLQNYSGATALAMPPVPQKYYIQVTENNCAANDSVMISVLPKDTVVASADTSICLGDTIFLRCETTASILNWSGNALIGDPSAKLITAQPAVSGSYIITVNSGKCATSDTVNVLTVAYPSASVTGDTLICFGGKTRLNGVIKAAYFSWSPQRDMLGYNTLSPWVAPGSTTKFMLGVNDTLGCPKTVFDSITVAVIPPFTVNAGRDTAIIGAQPFQLHAFTDADPVTALFSWQPATGLDDPFSPQPIAHLSGFDSIVYKVTVSVGQCTSQDEVKIKVYKGSAPKFYVPNAFSPNNDGLNDIFRVRSAGIASFSYLRVYDRWGQLIYESHNAGDGWDGRYKGLLQPSGTYVYNVRGIDYQGNAVEQNGTVVLVR